MEIISWINISFYQQKGLIVLRLTKFEATYNMLLPSVQHFIQLTLHQYKQHLYDLGCLTCSGS